MGISSRWSNSKLAYQLVIARISTDSYFEDEEYQQYIKKLVNNGIGGFCIFDGNTDTVQKMTEQLQAIAEIPLIFCADFENGLSMRLTEGTAFPHAMAIGHSNNIENTFKISSAIAKECLSIGVKWNLAPVCDINSNPDNPIINIRAFGENSQIVSDNIIQYINGLQQNKVVATAKHFPGHGDTSLDSHSTLPIIEKELGELYNNELKPFIKAIENNVWTIMVGHLYIKSIDKESIPASLSSNVINFLKKELNYNGIVLTDALDMKSITDYIDANKATYYALKAGNDLALIPLDVIPSVEYLTQQLENDSKLRLQLEQSAEKFYNLKRRSGLIPQYALLNMNTQIFNEHLKLALRVAFDSIQLDGDRNIIPIKENINFASFAILQRDTDLQAANRFFTMLAQALENDCDFGFIDKDISEEDIQGLIEGTKEAELTIFPIFIKSHSYLGSVGLDENIKNAIIKLSNNKKRIIILFGSPYIKSEIEYDLLISTYSDSFASLAAAVIYLSGRDESLNY